MTKQIIEIADYIFANPDKEVSAVVSYFVVKCRKTSRTIERYIKQAREYNQTRINLQEEAKNEVLVESAKESIKKAIKTKDELLEFLSQEIDDYLKMKEQVKNGTYKAKKIGNELFVPTFADAKSAGVEISKLQGFYATEKKELEINSKQSVILQKTYIQEEDA